MKSKNKPDIRPTDVFDFQTVKQLMQNVYKSCQCSCCCCYILKLQQLQMITTITTTITITRTINIENKLENFIKVMKKKKSKTPLRGKKDERRGRKKI